MDPEAMPPTDKLSPDEAVSLTSLEQRVRRLEEALASLPEPAGLEERIVERVRARLDRSPSRESVPAQNSLSEPPPSVPGARAGEQEGPSLRLLLPQSSWLVGELLADLRDLVVMWTDRRYRVSWPTPLLLLVLAALVFSSGWWSPLSWVPLVGWLLDKALDLLLAFLLFKILSREIRRYRQAVGKGS